MSNVHFKRTTCRLCESTALTCVLSLAPTPPANEFLSPSEQTGDQERFPLDVSLCESCGHLQLVDVVDPSRLFERYVYVSGTSPVFVAHFEAYAAHLVDSLGLKPGGFALDVGSNDGVLLSALKGHGMQVLGVDPAKDIAARANAAGLPTLNDFFTADLASTVRDQHGPASLVTANNVFAHADGLADIAAGVRELLTPDGVFVFEVSYLVDVYEQNLFDTIYHEHLAYHALGPLVDFFPRHELAVFDVERIPTHGGSLRVYVQRRDGARPVSPAVGERVAEERALGLFDVDTYRGWSDRIEQLGTELRDELERLVGEGKRVAGFGAPAKATTLMHQFGIDARLIEYIIDDSPWKQGLLSPGLHIPVVSPSEMETRWPDCLVILAWNFADPIINRYSDYLDQGGCFLVPLPTLRIVTGSSKSHDVI